VRLIDQDGNQHGIVDTIKALEMAFERNLDLVEVAPMARPPVCKIMDYGKYKYDQAKRVKQAKKKQHQIQIKEVQFRPNIESHDYNFKKKHLIDFIDHGNKVKVQVIFRGREIVHQEIGRELLDKLIEDVKDVADVESPVRMEGRQLTCTFIPVKKKDRKVKKQENTEEVTEQP